MPIRVIIAEDAFLVREAVTRVDDGRAAHDGGAAHVGGGACRGRAHDRQLSARARVTLVEHVLVLPVAGSARPIT